MNKTLGKYQDMSPGSPEYLTLGFSPTSIPLQQRWRNNGLSADFLADYLTTFFPKDENDPSTTNRQAEVKSAVSYIANELLENAMKFSDDTQNYPISIRLELETDKIIFFASNTVPKEQITKFQEFLDELLSVDPGDFFVNQLEKNAADENSTGSGLGFATMLNDYMAELGWKFETVSDNANMVTVTTRVELVI